MRRIFLALVAAYLATCAAWLVANFGTLPRYGDSYEYLQRSRSMELDPYRGIAYPVLLNVLDRSFDDEPLELAWQRAWEGDPAPRRGMTGFLVLQVLQFAALTGSLLYFLRVFFPRIVGRRRLVLLLLLLLDPWLSHFQLAVMSDGLTLSACLVFCAALAELCSGRKAITGPALALLASFLVATNLRVEKTWILGATALSTLAVWRFLERGRAAQHRLLAGRRALLIAALVLPAAATSLVLKSSFQGPNLRWPEWEAILDARVLFPHLSAVYDRLPADIRADLTPLQARQHDVGNRGMHGILDRVTGGDPVRRRAFLERCALVVARERWGRIAFNVLADTAENVGATLSLYGRLGALCALGETAFENRFRDDWSRWTLSRLLHPYPRFGLACVIAAAGMFVLCLVPAFLGWRSRLRPAMGIVWLPVGMFVLMNALAFALVADLVHPRYVLLAHAVGLLLVYDGALRWAGGEEEPAP